MKKTLITVMMLIALGIGQSVSAATNQSAKFQDIQGHWAQSAIDFMVAEGAISGYLDGTFRPDGTITRAEFSKILGGLMKVSSNTDAFKDTKGNWAASVINGMVEEDVIETAEYTVGFKPDAQITRLEMSKMVARGLAQENLLWNDALTGFKQLPAIKLPFSDQSEMEIADLPYIALASSSGIVSGYTDGTFRIERSATRAEAAVMLKRYLDAKNKKPVLSELLEMFKSEKTIHDYSKKEMEAWIDREADLKRLNNFPINDFLDRSLSDANYEWIHPLGPQSNRTKMATEQLNAVSGYMDMYYNRNYKTIGNAWKNDIRYYYRTGFEYNGVNYKIEDLPKMFDKFVQETKDEKRISESIFVSDVSMVYIQSPIEDVAAEWMVRGTQYIRYTSGTNLPKGVDLNKWYKRDVDARYFMSSSKVPWEASDYPIYEVYPITSYSEVKN